MPTNDGNQLPARRTSAQAPSQAGVLSEEDNDRHKGGLAIEALESDSLYYNLNGSSRRFIGSN